MKKFYVKIHTVWESDDVVEVLAKDMDSAKIIGENMINRGDIDYDLKRVS